MEARAPGRGRASRRAAPRLARPLPPRPQAAAPPSPRRPPGVPVARTHLSPPGCRPPWLPPGFRRRHRRDASRAGAAAAAAGARARPSVRPAGRALRPELRHSAPKRTRPRFSFPPFGTGLGRPGLQPSCWDAATTGTRGRGDTQMATAGGAKMEPASCGRQSRSRNALRCLRSVPRGAERHSAEQDGGSATA